ncbi:MAG: protein translocase subunit SecF [Actinomadura rubrobrunea]|nr:protein translocase subunit SecF [Actinomadura rubrobrunea]
MLALRAIVSRFYRGEVSADIVGRPKLWYSLSGLLLALSIAGLLLQGLNFGVEFRGGSVFTFGAPGHSIEDVRGAVQSGGAHQAIVQKAGGDWRVTTESLSSHEVNEVKKSIADELGVPADKVSTQVVGASWGGEISQKAWQALAVFMVLIIAYLSLAFEWRMALAALVALLHDLVITAGVYAWSGFEVTPATLLGFLTILGYSLYDAVVVFDMIKEVTRPLGPSSKITYSQAANQALASTLVRSLNTSLVAILPVAAILFIGTTLFGAGTLKDLSLALFVGMIVGTYSSICVATPLLVQLKEREPRYRQLRENIARREASAKRQAKSVRPRAAVAAAGGPSGGSAAVT